MGQVSQISKGHHVIMIAPSHDARKALIGVCACVAMATAFPCVVQAQSIKEAVAIGLEASPGLKAERMRLEALNEQRVQAFNQRRPTVQVEASTGLTLRGQKLDGAAYNWRNTEPGNASLVLTQPLFLGGRLQASVREAELRVAQGLARVRALELATVRQILEAYADVVRDNEILLIRQEVIASSGEQLAGAQARQNAGIIGLTELSQAQSRLAGARSSEANARARLTTSWAVLERLLDQRPMGLSENELTFMDMPATLMEAVEAGIALSYDVKVARFNEDIARAAARVSQSETAPRASLQAGVTGTSDSTSNGSRTREAQISARIVIPIWNGGQPQSRVRASLAQANAARMDSLELEQQLKERITSAWANLVAARASVEAAREQVRASLVAQTGARLEQKIGVRSTLEVLNQEQEVLEAKVALASAQREVMVGQAVLMTLTGKDPTGVITPDSAFDPTRLPERLNLQRAGQIRPWEGPLVGIHDVLIPLDASTARVSSDGRRTVLGPEE